MSRRFPRAQVGVTYHFNARHTVPASLHPESNTPHWHEYELTIGYHHERNGPFTWDREELHQKFKWLIEKLNNSYLNELINDESSDEVLASWCLTQLPGWVDFVTITRETPDELSIRAITTVRRKDLE